MQRTISSREFNQDTSAAKKASQLGPVFITDRGKPAHVLLSIQDYEKLLGNQLSLAQAVGQREGDDFDFVPPRLNLVLRPVEF